MCRTTSRLPNTVVDGEGGSDAIANGPESSEHCSRPRVHVATCVEAQAAASGGHRCPHSTLKAKLIIFSTIVGQYSIRIVRYLEIPDR